MNRKWISNTHSQNNGLNEKPFTIIERGGSERVENVKKIAIHNIRDTFMYGLNYVLL